MNPEIEFRLLHAFCFSKERKEGHVIYYETYGLEETQKNVYSADFYFKYKSFYEDRLSHALSTRFAQNGFEIDFKHEQHGDVYHIIFDKIKVNKISTMNIIPCRIRKKKFGWLNDLFINPLKYQHLRSDILKYFSGIDEFSIFMELYNQYKDEYPKKEDFLKYKRTFMKREDFGFDKTGKSSSSMSIEYMNIVHTFLKGVDMISHLIQTKNLNHATDQIKKLDTYYLISKKSKIEQELGNSYGLDFNEKEEEPENPSEVSEEVIDFMSNFHFKMMPKMNPDVENTQKTLYRIKPQSRPSSEDQKE